MRVFLGWISRFYIGDGKVKDFQISNLVTLSVTQTALVNAILICCYCSKVFELVFDRFFTYLECPVLRRPTVNLALSLVTGFKN